MLRKLVDDARVSRAQSESEAIAGALADLHEDTAKWAYTDTNGPAGSVDRLVGSTKVPTGAGEGAGAGAANWGIYGAAKALGDFLYWNNPDDNSSASGADADEANGDYPTSGAGAWKGPYVPSYELEDPWGNAYVVNVRYLPGGRYGGTVPHRTIVLSAGPDGLWQTPFSDSQTEEILGDDIGHVIHVR
jgi:hypothetical protein